jgi:hypothetical protein
VTGAVLARIAALWAIEKTIPGPRAEAHRAVPQKRFPCWRSKPGSSDSLRAPKAMTAEDIGYAFAALGWGHPLPR